MAKTIELAQLNDIHAVVAVVLATNKPIDCYDYDSVKGGVKDSGLPSLYGEFFFYSKITFFVNSNKSSVQLCGRVECQLCSEYV